VARGSGLALRTALLLGVVLAPGAALASVQPCTEAGLDAAVSAGGTNTFSCAGPTTITITTSKMISVASLVLDGGGLLTISGNNALRVFQVGNTSSVTFQNLAINNGSLTNGNGAAILNFGTATIVHSSFSNNSIVNGGGAALQNVGAMTVDTSSFLNNSVTASSPTNNADGAAINNNGSLMTVSNSTFSGNSAGRGGAILASTSMTVYNSTIVNNSASVSCGAGAIFAGTGTTTFANTIMANNTSGGACRPNCNGNVAAGPDSIADTPNCGSATQATFAQINLGALTGSPAYFPLSAGSVAIDAGSNAICAAAPVNNTSQNGIARPADGNGDNTATCDVGSFEAAAIAPPIIVAPTTPLPAPMLSQWMMLLLGAGLAFLAMARMRSVPADESR